MKWDRKELAKFIGTMGVAMLIAGYLRYTIQGELLTFSKVVLILGGLFVLRIGGHWFFLHSCFLLQAFFATRHQHGDSNAGGAGNPGGREFCRLPPS